MRDPMLMRRAASGAARRHGGDLADWAVVNTPRRAGPMGTDVGKLHPVGVLATNRAETRQYPQSVAPDILYLRSNGRLAIRGALRNRTDGDAKGRRPPRPRDTSPRRYRTPRRYSRQMPAERGDIHRTANMDKRVGFRGACAGWLKEERELQRDKDSPRRSRPAACVAFPFWVVWAKPTRPGLAGLAASSWRALASSHNRSAPARAWPKRRNAGYGAPPASPPHPMIPRAAAFSAHRRYAAHAAQAGYGMGRVISTAGGARPFRTAEEICKQAHTVCSHSWGSVVTRRRNPLPSRTPPSRGISAEEAEFAE